MLRRGESRDTGAHECVFGGEVEECTTLVLLEALRY